MTKLKNLCKELLTKKNIAMVLEVILFILIILIGFRSIKIENDNKHLKEEIVILQKNNKQLEKDNARITANNDRLLIDNERFSNMSDEFYNLFLTCQYELYKGEVFE